MTNEASLHASSAKSDSKPRGLLEQRLAIFLGLIMLGLGLRYAVTGLSPILKTVSEHMNISVTGKTIIGMLPTICFGIGGFSAPVLARKIGQETTAFLAVALASFGTLLRPWIMNFPIFVTLSVLALIGMGFGNAIGAPLVKKYFPDRQGSMITVFSLLMQAGATLPAMTVGPVMQALGWQASLASWGLLSAVACIPWLLVMGKARSKTGAAQGKADAARGGEKEESFSVGRLLSNPISLGTGLFYAMASLNIYGMLAWLPTILQQHNQMSEADAMVPFAIYTFVTLPMAFITPQLAVRIKNPTWVAICLSLSGSVGYLLLLFGIGPAWVGVLVASLQGGAFPFAIAHFNLRTRTPAGSAAIAGFAMGTGYLVGTLGPLVGGWLNGITGNWVLALWFFTATGVVMALMGIMMAKPGRFLEDPQ